MIPRIYRRPVRDRLGKFPAVAIVGPRQCGKTTLAASHGQPLNASQIGASLALNHKTVLGYILDRGTERWAIEIKLTSNPSPAELDRLNATADLIDAKRRVLVCRISRKIETEKLLVTHLSGWLRQLAA